MVGDMLSHTVWSMDQVHRVEGGSDERFFGDGQRRTSNITHITYRRGGLGNVRQALIDRQAARRRPVRVTPDPSAPPVQEGV
jgi:hypothetical protein